MTEQEFPLLDSLARLAPFVLRARAVSTGREKLLQHRNQLAFALVTEDISENSRREVLRDFPCPVYQALTAAQVDSLFHFHNTKLLGFARSALSAQIQKLLKGRRLVAPSVEEVAMPQNPNVVVLGASGIGRHHINWWKCARARVSGFLGSTPESIQRTAADLENAFGEPIKGYDNLERLLQHCQPDIVDVCLPPSLHFRAARAALLAGCHVLCEKPFLYDETLPPAVLHQQCNELCELANARSRLLGMCSQYFEIARRCLAQNQGGETPVTNLAATLVTPLRHHATGALSAWLDLGPHLLAFLQAITLTRHLRPESVQVEVSGINQFTAKFSCTDRTDNPNPPPPLECLFTVAHRPNNLDTTNLRQFQLDGQSFVLENAIGDDGRFAMKLKNITAQTSVLLPDPMRTLIENFACGRALIPGRMAAQNLNWTLKIAQEIAKNRPAFGKKELH